MLKALKDHYLRIDARSLGLFRLAFGLVLLADLVRRWRWLTAFYSNEGVLPNHNHLFNLRDTTGYVWSFLHAFSSPGENHFAFLFILFVYIAFFIGWNTRVFHALALVCLVSLTGRNILLENAGSYAAIALLAFTLFLPCGSRFSVDSMRASLRLQPEKNEVDLNKREPLPEALVSGLRLPGSSPTSLAALALLLQIAVIFIALAYQHDGAPWKDGSALYYALHTERWTSSLGVGLRALPAGALKGLTYAIHASEWAIPALLFIPALRGPTRLVASALMAFYGLSFGLFFSYGLFGWSLAAAAALVLSTESWDAFEKRFLQRRARTVIYDADCGVCLLICRILKRMDTRAHLTFQGNTNVDEVLEPGPPGTQKRVNRPAALAPETVLSTVVVLDKDGHVFTKERAIAEIIQALPLGFTVAWLLRVPGIAQIKRAAYDVIAARRQAISELLGLGSCGVPTEDEAPPGVLDPQSEVPPARRTLNIVTGLVRDLCALAVLVAMFSQTAKENRLPSVFPRVPQKTALEAIAKWPRMMAKWDILAPAPPTSDSAFIIDAQTKGDDKVKGSGVAVDPLTGREPAFDPAKRRGAALGQLWSDYLDRLHQKDWSLFQKAFRDNISKGGPAWKTEPPENQIIGFDAYWVTTPIPPPGGAPETRAPEREKLFTHSRGGRASTERAPVIVRPEQRGLPRQQ